MKSVAINRHELTNRLKHLEVKYQEAVRERARFIRSYDENLLDSEVEQLIDSIHALDKKAAELQTEIKTLKGALK